MVYARSGQGKGVARQFGRLLREVATKEELLERDVLRAPGLACHRLLRDEASCREHRKPPMRELALLHFPELGRIFWFEAERVEAKVARIVVWLQRLDVLHARVWIRPTPLRSRLARLRALLYCLPEQQMLRMCIAHPNIKLAVCAYLDAKRFADANTKRHPEPERRWEARDLLDRRAAIRGEERVEVLLHEEARCRKHADPPVCELSLAITVHLAL
mmetsp:Transcript_5049/g.11507  ORF Transcript_5049/g.11507 Transcript_5049/m.11507 type:complete len:217 (+) Transcript_5049:267-917(+)